MGVFFIQNAIEQDKIGCSRSSHIGSALASGPPVHGPRAPGPGSRDQSGRLGPATFLTRQPPNPGYSSSTTWRGALNIRVKARHTVKRKTPTLSRTRSELQTQSGSCRTNGQHRPTRKRKRWCSYTSNTVWGPNNLCHRPAKSPWQDIDRREDTLWTSLRQLVPRKQRSS
jgi:hypothetical protein